MHNLYEKHNSYGYYLSSIPFVIQYNKRDLSNLIPMPELRAQLNASEVSDFEAVSTEGKGVFETLKAVSKQVVKTLS